MKRIWTQEEVHYLIEKWGRVPLEQIMEALDRTEDSVMRKARRLGLDVHKKEEDVLKRKWSKEEDNFIIENYKVLSSKEISQHLNRTASAIRKRALALGISGTVNRWSEEEENFLKEKWGILNVDAVAKKLNRSRNAILLKAYQMSLREQITANGAYLTPNDISSILGVNTRTLYSWIYKGKIRHRRFKVGKKKKYQITVDAFCEFLEKYQDKWDSQKADLQQIKAYYVSYFITSDNTLTIRGELPKWLKKKIERDKQGFKELMKPWTTKEEEELLLMVESKYTYKDISLIFGRSIESVKTKLYMLNKQNSELATALEAGASKRIAN